MQGGLALPSFLAVPAFFRPVKPFPEIGVTLPASATLTRCG